MSTTPAAHTTPAQPVKQAYAPQNTPLSTGQTRRTTSSSAKQLPLALTASGLTRRQQRDKARLKNGDEKSKDNPTTPAQQQIGRQ
ncbi:unnamed protein product [Macrosiphum euphorbiae]|uniref:Uncharacterized protein n=1 Tax=Macrosiphum euphorbiae TaxID=13131 RepID=A0AAV0XMS7_9HEMI|nr:unnamed protein product [Macrosiphum euphorbiae]